MSFANFKAYEKGKSTFRRTEFVDFSVGQHTIRILSENAVIHDTHYVHNTTIKCLGEDCPICQNNKKMFLEFGREAPKKPGFIPQRQVGYINVLDRTPVKMCPNTECQKEVKKSGAVFPPVCPKCGASLVSVPAKPLDKVKVVSKGKKFFDQIEYYASAVLDETETPIPVSSYDMDVLVLDKKTVPTLAAKPERNDVLDVPADALFDLDKALVILEVSEVNEFLRGVGLKDIFAARKATGATTDTPETNQDLLKEIADTTESIFEN